MQRRGFTPPFLTVEKSVGVERAGFTIVELIVALAIIALAIGMSVPMFARFASGIRLNSASRQMVTALRTARGYAITNRKDCSVVFDKDEGKFWISQDHEVVEKSFEFSKAIEIISTDFPDDQVTFYSTGSSKHGGNIMLRDKRGKTMAITVIKVTGGVKIQ